MTDKRYTLHVEIHERVHKALSPLIPHGMKNRIGAALFAGLARKCLEDMKAGRNPKLRISAVLVGEEDITQDMCDELLEGWGRSVT